MGTVGRTDGSCDAVDMAKRTGAKVYGPAGLIQSMIDLGWLTAEQGVRFGQGGKVQPLGPQITITQVRAEHSSELTVTDPATKTSTTYSGGGWRVASPWSSRSARSSIPPRHGPARGSSGTAWRSSCDPCLGRISRWASVPITTSYVKAMRVQPSLRRPPRAPAGHLAPLRRSARGGAEPRRLIDAHGAWLLRKAPSPRSPAHCRNAVAPHWPEVRSFDHARGLWQDRQHDARGSLALASAQAELRGD